MFNKIAVLFGGDSSEKKISFQSSKEVTSALHKNNIQANAIDIKNFSVINLKKNNYTKAFIVAHGGKGENGVLQGMLEYINLPYTGSGVLASSLSMDKIKIKQLWSGLGLPHAPYLVLHEKKMCSMSNAMLYSFVEKLGLPLIIKPNSQGSSIGITKVEEISKLKESLNFAYKYNKEVLIEKYLKGPEYTVSILGDLVFPSIFIEPDGNFHNFHSKYISKKSNFFCPSGLKEEEEAILQKLALSAYKSINCYGCARIDVIRNKNVFYLLEINTSPGMSSRSLFPISAKQFGIDFIELVKKILEFKK